MEHKKMYKTLKWKILCAIEHMLYYYCHYCYCYSFFLSPFLLNDESIVLRTSCVHFIDRYVNEMHVCMYVCTVHVCALTCMYVCA